MKDKSLVRFKVPKRTANRRALQRWLDETARQPEIAAQLNEAVKTAHEMAVETMIFGTSIRYLPEA